MNARVLMMAASLTVLLSCDDSTDPDAEFDASLNGASEVPAVTTQATGTFSATVDDDNVMTYTLTFTGLGSNVTMAHIHGPAAAGVNAGILLDFAAGGRVLPLNVTNGTATGTVDLNTVVLTNTAVSGDSLLKLLNNGNSYVNVHSTNNPGGEIRGQVDRQ